MEKSVNSTKTKEVEQKLAQKRLIELKFRTGNLRYYQKPDFSTNPNDYVIVKVEKGFEIARVVSTDCKDADIQTNKIASDDLTVVRVATGRDLSKLKYLEYEQKKACEIFNATLFKYPLQIKLFKAVQQYDNKKITFLFTAPKRADFREFVRELARIMSKRIELIQISSREKSKIMGGIGLCGYQYCCSKFLKRFVNVSIRTVKEQNTSLNLSKSLGPCGKLLCCLNYETNCETCPKKYRTPKVGDTICIEGKKLSVSSFVVENSNVQILSKQNPENTVVIPLKRYEEIFVE